MTEIFEKQIVKKLPIGLIVFDNEVPSEVSMIHNVENLLGRDPLPHKDAVRFWAKHQDLPIPLFHLILHYYYLRKIRHSKDDALAECWKNELFKPNSLITLESTNVHDINGDVIRTVAQTKNISFLEKRLEKAKSLSGQERADAIAELERDVDTNSVGDNYYKSYITKNYLAFLQHVGVVADGELTDYGYKLYHLGLMNGPNSKVFRDYFLKCVLEEGSHLYLIFDLDRLCREYRGQKITEEIKGIMESEYDGNGMVKRNPNRIANSTSNTGFLKYELILWNSLSIIEKTKGKPDLAFNWKKIDEVRTLPEL